MDLSTQTKISLGSVMSAFGGLGIMFFMLWGESAESGPWGFLLAFIIGVLSSVGATLTVAGLLERRRNP